MRCPTCSGKVTLWYRGEEVLRVTARKGPYNEVAAEDFICNTCRFDKKATADWVIEGPRAVDHGSVISANHYVKGTKQAAFPVEVAAQYYKKIDDLPLQPGQTGAAQPSNPSLGPVRALPLVLPVGLPPKVKK